MKNNFNALSIIVLTYNEEIHIERCLKSASLISNNIYVVDSYSTDKTIEIAKKFTPNIFQGYFGSFSSKLNWAIENLPISTTWTIRLDADELFSQDFIESIYPLIDSQPSNISGIYVRRQLWFLNRWIKYGSMYPIYSLRVWKTGYVFCENRLLDEHMILKDGLSINSKIDVIDNPLISLKSWIDKHNKYSDSEVQNYLMISNESDIIKGTLISSKQEERKRYLKDNFYYKLPLFIRPFFYFVYRYIIRFGFLDGKEGLIWNILHGFWYRFLIDSKIYESRNKKS
jgi:glycosyltransferase involved in cell wall biosynthesis